MQQKELRSWKDRALTILKHQCQILTRMNELRRERIVILERRFALALRMGVEEAVQLRLEQINEERQPVVDDHPNPVQDNVKQTYVSSEKVT